LLLRDLYLVDFIRDGLHLLFDLVNLPRAMLLHPRYLLSLHSLAVLTRSLHLSHLLVQVLLRILNR
jgi:hypothetical protein